MDEELKPFRPQMDTEPPQVPNILSFKQTHVAQLYQHLEVAFVEKVVLTIVSIFFPLDYLNSLFHPA